MRLQTVDTLEVSFLLVFLLSPC